MARIFQDESRDILSKGQTRAALVTGLEVDPPELIERNAPEVRPFLADHLVCAACDQASGDEFALALDIVTAPLARQTDSVFVRCRVEATDPDGLMAALPEQQVKAEFPCFTDVDQLHPPRIPLRDLLRAGASELAAAMERAARALSTGKLSPALVTQEFMEHLRNSGIAADESALNTLFRGCVAVIAGQAHRLSFAPHAVNVSRGSPEQLVRKADSAKAWRIDITQHGAGWRVEYWHVPPQTADSRECVEFVKILTEGAADHLH